MNILVRHIKINELEGLEIKCAHCSFWFNCARGNLVAGSNSKNIIDFLKSKIYAGTSEGKDNKGIKRFCRYGGRVLGAFDDNNCIGVLMYGKHYLFPRIRSFKVYPPDSDSLFIGCIYVKSGYRDIGIGQRLLMSVERELLKKGVKSVEIIGQRNFEINHHRELVPVKFLIKNGFYIHKNDYKYPLLRLDLGSIVKDFNLEKVLKRNMLLNKRLELPGRYYNR